MAFRKKGFANAAAKGKLARKNQKHPKPAWVLKTSFEGATKVGSVDSKVFNNFSLWQAKAGFVQGEEPKEQANVDACVERMCPCGASPNARMSSGQGGLPQTANLPVRRIDRLRAL